MSYSLPLRNWKTKCDDGLVTWCHSQYTGAAVRGLDGAETNFVSFNAPVSGISSRMNIKKGDDSERGDGK